MNTTTHADPSGTPGVARRLDPVAFGAAAAAVAAAAMLVLGIAGGLGVYEGAVEMMQEWHMFFSPTTAGTIAGMIEAAAITFVFAWLLAWLYNAWAR